MKWFNVNQSSYKSLSFLWWVLVLVIVLFSLFAAIIFEDNNAIREMSTSAFGGAIVGALILAYEQFREEHREKIQFDRDVRLARRISDDANFEKDARSLADFVLKELAPVHYQYLMSYESGQIKIRLDLENTLEDKIKLAEFYIKRVGGEMLLSRWDIFCEKTNNFLYMEIKEKIKLRAKANKEHLLKELNHLHLARDLLVESSEKILEDLTSI